MTKRSAVNAYLCFLEGGSVPGGSDEYYWLLHRLRNPWGLNNNQQRAMRLDAAEAIEVLHRKVKQLEAGEFICRRCHLRKDADASGTEPTF